MQNERFGSSAVGLCDCEAQSTTLDTQAADEPSFGLSGAAAREIAEQINKFYGVEVSGKGWLSCTYVEADPIPNGIVVPTGFCTAVPHVDFPEGTAGIVAPWFQIDGFAAVRLFEEMPVSATDKQKVIEGDFTINCDSRAT